MIKFNKIDDNNVQVYGVVNGVINRRFENNRYYWVFNIRFNKSHTLHKVNNFNNRTHGTIDKSKDYIINLYNEA